MKRKQKKKHQKKKQISELTNPERKIGNKIHFFSKNRFLSKTSLEKKKRDSHREKQGAQYAATSVSILDRIRRYVGRERGKEKDKEEEKEKDEKLKLNEKGE